MTEQKHYSWDSGMPTSPDVTLIREKYKELKVGDRITYEEMSKLIGVPKDSGRFISVTNAWRKRELQDGRGIKCETGEGFIVASFDQITEGTIEAFSSIGRKARKQWKHLATIRPSDEREKQIKEHQMRLCSMQDKDARKTRMNILPALDAPTVVRISPPQQDVA